MENGRVRREKKAADMGVMLSRHPTNPGRDMCMILKCCGQWSRHK